MIPDTIRGKIRMVLMIVEQKTILSTKMAKIIPIVTSKKHETEANTKVLQITVQNSGSVKRNK